MQRFSLGKVEKMEEPANPGLPEKWISNESGGYFL